MKNRLAWLIPLLAALAFGSLMLASCGGDDDDDVPSAGSTDGKTPADKKSGGSVSGSGADELTALAKKADSTSYTATYEAVFAGDSGPEKGNWTLARKDKKSYTRIEFTEGESKGSELILIEDGTDSFFCTREEGDKNGSCLKSKSTGNQNLGFDVDSVLGDAETSTNVTEAGDRKIAGADSKCFKFKDSDGSDGTACFDKKTGIVTALDGKDGDGKATKLTATKIAASANDKLFAPPDGWEVSSFN